MIRSVYLPSYYYEERSELALHRDITRRWWDEERAYYDVYISEIVLMELERGNYPYKTEILQLISELPVLEVSDEIGDIVQVYLGRTLMPKSDLGDAFHLALASYHKVDFLLTWNCRNLANANKLSHIRLVNMQLGLFTPQIVTPEQLFAEGDE